MRKRIAGLLGCLLVLATGARAQVVPEKRIAAAQMQFTQDGKELLAKVFEKNNTTGAMSPWHLMRWDVENGRELSRVRLPGLPFLRYLFSPDGRLFYRPPMKEEGEQIVLCDAVTGKQVCTLETAGIRVLPQKFSADGKLLLGSWEWGHSGFWDTRTGKQVPLFASQGESERFDTTLFSTDNRRVVRIGLNKNEQKATHRWVVVFDRKTGKRLNSFFIENKKIRDYELSPNGRYLLGRPERASVDQKPAQIPLWSMENGTLLHLLALKPDYLTSFKLHFSADGKRLFALVSTYDRLNFYQNSRYPYARQTWSTSSGQELSNTGLPIEVITYFNGIRPTPTMMASSVDMFAQFTNENSIRLISLENGEVAGTIRMDEIGLRS